MSAEPGIMHDRPRVSIVVPTYRRRAELPRFVAAALEDPAVYELVVAVDGSNDGTVEWLQQEARADPRIVVLDLPNRGAGVARQAGIEAARGDVVLLMDHDVVAEPRLASGHAAHHARGEHKLVLGYMPNDWESQPRGRRGTGMLYRRAYERQCERYARDPDFVLYALWGGNFSLSREDFLRIGFEKIAAEREEDRGGEEDREFGIRCRQAGIEGCFDSSLRATHEYSRSLAQYRSDCRQAGQSRRRMYEAHADLLGEDLEIGHTLPEPMRRLMPLLASEPAFTVLAAILRVVFHVGVRVGLVDVEAFAARGLGSLEVQRGAMDGRDG
jgi:glycosyltransferase involved in cell wall biosynthesis